MTTKRTTLRDHTAADTATGSEFVSAITPGGMAAPTELPREEAAASPVPPRKRRATTTEEDDRHISTNFRITQELQDLIRDEAFARAQARRRGSPDLSEIVREALEEYFQRRGKRQ